MIEHNYHEKYLGALEYPYADECIHQTAEILSNITREFPEEYAWAQEELAYISQSYFSNNTALIEYTKKRLTLFLYRISIKTGELIPI